MNSFDPQPTAQAVGRSAEHGELSKALVSAKSEFGWTPNRLRRWLRVKRALGRFSISVAHVVAFVVISSLASAAEKAVFTDIPGVKRTGTLKSWSGDKLTVEIESTKEISQAAVRAISFERPPKKLTDHTATVWLSNGDRISSKAVKVVDDILTVSWPILGAAEQPTIPLEKVVALILEMPVTINERFRLFADIETLPPGNDLVMLTNGDRMLGEFERLDAAFVEQKLASGSLKLARSRVRAIRLNPELTNVTRPNGRRIVVSLTDGSRLTAMNIEFTDNVVKLKSRELGNLTIPISAVAMCQVFGERVIPITDYEPTKIEFTPYLSAIWPLERNSNVLHGPLMIRGTEYVTGLGTHSRMAVTYDLRGNERAFQSVVGIDDAANGAGSVIFAVELDGRRFWTSSEITGKSPLTNIPEIDVRGCKRMTLVVDFGQFADVSDYADWCDAVLILDRSR